ncbi:MAG: PLDc N-terminal domain-containing protein [Dehalococcoidia bacterium]|jgi:hypothetical protein
MFYGGGIVGLIALILDILAIYDLLKRKPDTIKLILWLIIIIVLPIIGAILYYLLGRK